MAVFTGGDDLSAIVADIGTTFSKIGYAGTDSPVALFPTVAGVVCDSASSAGSASSSAPGPRRYGRGRYTFDLLHDSVREGMCVRSPLGDGLVEDWDMLESLLDYALVERLHVPTPEPSPAPTTAQPSASASVPAGTGLRTPGRVTTDASKAAPRASSSRASAEADLSAHPFLLCEHAYASKMDREKWCEMLFEKYKCPGVFMSKAGVLVLYANARTSGMAVDMGGGGTTITPVQEGYPLMLGVKINPMGGNFLDQQLQRALQARGISITPRPSSSSASVAQFIVQGIVREMKEGVLKVSEEKFDPTTSANMPSVPYELPDGTHIAVGVERFSIAELLFDPSELVTTMPGVTSIQHSLLASAMACEPEIRRELVSNLVLSGAASALSGIGDRVLNEFAEVAPPGLRPRMASAFPGERAIGAWLGGSILGSLGTFHDMWFTADEYAEYGAKMIHRKCP